LLAYWRSLGQVLVERAELRQKLVEHVEGRAGKLPDGCLGQNKGRERIRCRANKIPKTSSPKMIKPTHYRSPTLFRSSATGHATISPSRSFFGGARIMADGNSCDRA
jgi:hypothetical protein